VSGSSLAQQDESPLNTWTLHEIHVGTHLRANSSATQCLVPVCCLNKDPCQRPLRNTPSILHDIRAGLVGEEWFFKPSAAGRDIGKFVDGASAPVLEVNTGRFSTRESGYNNIRTPDRKRQSRYCRWQCQAKIFTTPMPHRCPQCIAHSRPVSRPSPAAAPNAKPCCSHRQARHCRSPEANSQK